MDADSSTVADVLRSQRHRGTKPLLICDDTRISYADAEYRSARLARGLIALGAGKGTHVGLLYPNGIEFVVAMLAAARIGAVVVPFSTFLTAPELHNQLVSGDIAIMLTASSYRSHDYVSRLVEAVDGIKIGSTEPLFNVRVPVLRARRQVRTVWQGCRSWYLDDRGHDTHNWPWLMSPYRRRTRRTRRIRAENYSIRRSSAPADW